MASSPTVRQISECFIKPKRTSKEAQEIVHLGPWDLVLLPFHYLQKGLLFTKPAGPVETLSERLKDSLSVTLVHFYSLAGQLETQLDEDNHTSLIFINCNKGPGARFIRAALDMTVSDILSPIYRPGVVNSMFDHNNAINHDGHTTSLMTVQVTELIDGVFISFSVNHACVDGTSFWHFMNAWSEIFMGNGDENTPMSRPPIYKRWFLDGSGPAKLPYTVPEEFVSRFQTPPYKERVFHFSAESIAKLKAKANADCGTTNKISSFLALAALVWRCITRARSMPDDEHTLCLLAINNRGRVRPPLSENYFGNSTEKSTVSSKAGELLQQSLGWAAMMLNEAVAKHDDKRVRSMIGTLMSPRMVQMLSNPNPYAVVFGSSTKFDMYGVQFGMGKALGVFNVDMETSLMER